MPGGLDLSRRQLGGLGLALTGLLGAATGCGGRRHDAAADGPTDAASGGFPVTISHRFGQTTIKRPPRRVVALGGGDMEAAIALGVIPVAGADWFSFTTPRIWVTPALHGRRAPTLLPSAPLPLEKIAAADPDLILYVNSRHDSNDFHRLAQIAPTVASPAKYKNADGVPWQAQLQIIATATGTSQRGRTVLADTNALVAKAARDNPEFAGKTITAGLINAGTISVWLPSDPRMRLLRGLGFTLNSRITKLDNGDFYVSLSEEKLELMNADLIFLAAQDTHGRVDPAIRSNAAFQNLATVRAGRVVYWPGAPAINTNTPGGAFASAISIGGSLGIPYCLPKLIPMLRRGLRG